MKTTTIAIRSKIRPGPGLFSLALLFALFALVISAGAASITKADNTTALGTGSSWTGGTAPGSGDVATWSGGYAIAGSLTAALPGSAVPWGGISIGNLSGAAVPTAAITAASQSGTTVTITAGTHAFAPGMTVVIAGVTPSGYNGTFTITGVPTSTTFTYTTGSGLTAGTAFGTASAMISIGGTGSAVASSALTIGSSGIDLSGANRSVVINSVTSAFSGAQTWNTAAGKVIRFGTTGTGGANAKVITSGSDGLIDISGSGIVDGNQGGASGFADAAGWAGFAGKWRVNSGATLRGLRNGSTAWGASTASDAITLNGGTLASGGISGAVGDWVWNSPITLATSTTSTIDNQNVSGSSRRLKLVGAFSGSGNLTFASTGAGTMSTDNGFIFAAASSMSGTITIPSGIFVRVGAVGGNDATFTSGTAGDLGTATVVNNGNLQLTHSDNFTFANTVSGTGLLRIGRSTGAENSGGVCTVSGNNSHTGGDIIMSSATLKLGHANAAGTGAISTGGSGSLDNGTGGALTIANALTLSGGSLTFVGSSDLTINGATTISGANRTLTVTAGTLTLGGGLGEDSTRNFTKDGAGALVLTGTSSYTGTTTISTAGGKLQIGNNGTAGTLASGAVTVTSATLSFKRSDSITVANTISGTGALSQDGSGTTTLTGTLSYSGATTVNAGKLFINTASTASAKTVSSGGTLGGNNSIGAVTVNNGGSITAGNGSGVGTTTMSTLTLGSTGTDAQTINVVAGAGGSAIAVTTSGGLVNNGVTTFAVTGSALNTPGTYTLATYTGSLGGSGTWAVSLPPRVAATLDFSTAGQINLVVTGTDTIKWTGATDGNWDTATTNWKQIVANTATMFINGTPGDTVTFDDTLTANPSVTLNSTLTPASVTVNNSSTTYSIGGSGKITGGTTSLTKTGTGTFTLGTTGGNDYSGGTTVSAGTLKLGAANVLPTGGTVTLNGTLDLNAGSQQVGSLTGSGTIGNTGGSTPVLTVNNSAAATFSGVIGDGSGTTALTKSGAGTLTLSGNNTYGGATTISAGTLEIGSGGASGTPGSAAIANSGTLRVNRSGTLTLSQNITGAGALTVVGSSDTTFSGSVANSVSVTGGGSNVFTGALTGTTVTQNGAGTMYLGGANTYSGATTVSAGTLIADGGSAIPDSGTVSIANGATFKVNATETIGGLSTVSGSTVNAASGTLTFTTGSIIGNLTGAGTVIRNGTTDTAAGQFTNANALNFTGTLRLRGSTPSASPGSMQGATGRFWLHDVNGSQATGTEFALDTGASGTDAQDFIIGDWDAASLNRKLTLSSLTGFGTIRTDAGLVGTRNLIVDQATDTTFNGMLLSHTSGNNTDIRSIAFEKKGVGTLTMANIVGKETQSAGAPNADVAITVTAGKLVFSAVNTLTGPTVVNGGTLVINGTHPSGATVTVNSGGTLGGTGTVSGTLTVAAGGIVTPGASIGTLTVGGTPSLGGKLLIEIDRNGGSPLADKISFTGSATFGGTLTVTNIGATAQSGDTFDLFDGSPTGVFASVNVPTGGLAHWKTNNLVVDGTITYSNAAPVAQNVTAGVVLGGTVTLPVIGGKNSATDGDGDAISVTAVSTPGSGSASFGASNVTYVASGSTGTNTFTYTVTDSLGATDTRTVTVIVGDPQGFNQVSAGVDGGNAVLSYLGIPGTNYALEITHNLPATNWAPVITNPAAANGYLYFTNPISLAPTNDYYRTRFAP